ncbi:uncharacterized protein LOC143869136 [Tasmannia lanceolata]|uniref:uncharacterized protein LOC143869136 n=1 Tax=Tasmannia lanceolata TaxID=3420 RepID=UPI0040638098
MEIPPDPGKSAVLDGRFWAHPKPAGLGHSPSPHGNVPQAVCGLKDNYFLDGLPSCVDEKPSPLSEPGMNSVQRVAYLKELFPLEDPEPSTHFRRGTRVHKRFTITPAQITSSLKKSKQNSTIPVKTPTPRKSQRPDLQSTQEFRAPPPPSLSCFLPLNLQVGEEETAGGKPSILGISSITHCPTVSAVTPDSQHLPPDVSSVPTLSVPSSFPTSSVLSSEPSPFLNQKLIAAAKTEKISIAPHPHSFIFSTPGNYSRPIAISNETTPSPSSDFPAHSVGTDPTPIPMPLKTDGSDATQSATGAATTQAKTSPWRSLFGEKSTKGLPKLEFVNPVAADSGKKRISFENEELEEIGCKWRTSLFTCLEDCDSVLESGEHSYAGRPLILRKWKPGTPLEKLNLTSIPVWVRLPGLPLEFWSAKGLSKIASFIGNPLYMDSRTAEETRLSYARMCVEVEAGAEFPETIPIHTPYGIHNQKVQYDWKPSACKTCIDFSHTSEACPKNVQVAQHNHKQEWRPVKNPSKQPLQAVKPARDREERPVKPTCIFPQVVEHSRILSGVSAHVVDTAIQIQNSFDALADVEGNENEEGEESEDQVESNIDDRDKLVGCLGKEFVHVSSSSGGIPEESPVMVEAQVQEAQDLNGHDSSQLHACVMPPSGRPIKLLPPCSDAKEVDVQRFLSEISKNWKCQTNYEFCGKGRIWVLWDPKVISFQVLYMNSQIIHGGCYCILTGHCIHLSAIYASNDAPERRQLWSSLVGLVPAAPVPWIALGDFNITRFADERWGGADPNTSDMNEFNACIEDCSLLDLRSVGQTLSWTNSSRTGHLKLRRLDRALVNEEWLHGFPISYVHYKNPGLSDHSPIIVSTSPVQSTGGKPFKFHNMWLSDTSLYEVVERAWHLKISGNPMFRIFKKLQGTKRAIKIWNHNSFGRIDILAPQFRKDLDEIQTKIGLDPRNLSLRAAEQDIREKFTRTAQQEESLFHQKSRVDWLNLGDSNTEYFHSAMSMRRNQNQIQAIEDDNGELCTEPKGIADILVNHFSCLLNHNCPMTGDLPAPQYKLSPDDARDLVRPFQAEEIKEVVFKCDGNRAPGPDGFNGVFFKHFWYLIATEVVEAIHYFFRTGNLLPAFNTTFIALIPKCSGASSPNHFRPISLCNFFYKIISKLLASRLSKVLNRIVSPNQSAFIKDRLIQDNVLLSHGLCHNFHKASNTKALCLKLDLKKAYDYVIHEALLGFMRKIGFRTLWCTWISKCIASPSFSVLLNGSPKGFFQSSNGLRQGDHLSPLLFCLVMEIFSCMLNSAQALGKIKTPFSKGNLNINHVMYADDVMVFITPDLESVAGIKECLQSFKRIAGLDVNFQKSEAFLSGTSAQLKDLICSSLCIKEGSLPIKYLGLPLITKRLSSHDCQPLLTKIRSRLGMWNNKKLSRAGRIELIKAVLTSFQIYWSATYNIPKEILLEIEKIFRNFLWGGFDQQNQYSPIAWASVCRPKREGGVGIRSVVDINRASQLKLLWHIVQNRESLWVRWFKIKYLKKSSFWNRPMPSNPAWGVRSIFNCRTLAKPFMCYCVGKGRNIDFWTDPWHPDGPVHTQTTEGELFCLTKQTSIECMQQDGSWAHILHQAHLPQLHRIMKTGLFSHHEVDRIIWKGNPNGKFSLRSAWNQCRTRWAEVPWFKTVWHKGHIPRYSFTTWQAMQNRLSTRDRLCFLGSHRDLSCLLCNAGPESENHLFFRCSYSAWIWRSILWRCGFRRKPLKTLLQEEMWIREKFKGDGQATSIMRLSFCVVVYMIWRERNSRLHGKHPCHKTSTLHSCLSIIHSRLAHLHLDDVISRKNVATAANFGLPCIQVKIDAVFCSWIRSDHEFYKINTDAAVHNGMGGIGGLIRNSMGEVQVMFSLRSGCEEIHLLEMKAILHGIILARTEGYESIWIESDSLVAVNVILEKWECPWKAIPIVEEIRDALRNTQNWKLSHIWREANGAADFLSKPDCCCKGAVLLPSTIPPTLRDILDLDAAGHLYPRV